MICCSAVLPEAQKYTGVLKGLKGSFIQGFIGVTDKGLS